MNVRRNVFFVFLMIAGAVGLMMPREAAAADGYGVIIPDQRIPFSESGHASGKWDARDVSIDYRYTTNGGQLTFAGAVNFADSIRYNYDWMPSFYAEVIFGDAQGRVLGSSSLLTARQSGFDRWEPVKFSKQIALPPGTVSFTFSYKGEVAEAKGGRGGGGGNLTYIWTYPVTKAAAVQR